MLARQTFYHLSHASALCDLVNFSDKVLSFLFGWSGNMILLIAASQEAGIAGIHYYVWPNLEVFFLV
jgi:hypothetical protein